MDSVLDIALRPNNPTSPFWLETTKGTEHVSTDMNLIGPHHHRQKPPQQGKRRKPSRQARKHILFIVENSVVPIDSRVWGEALAAKEWGYDVTVVCPKGKTYTKSFERLNGIDIYRHPLPLQASGKWSYLAEYLWALTWECFLCFRIFFKKRFHVIHGANPPDHLFLLASLFKLFGTKYIFDHHDLCPENYVAKFQTKDLVYKLLLIFEKLNFNVADIVISTNQSYKRVAIQRGRKDAAHVFVVRNGPRMNELYYPAPNFKWKDGFDYLVAYIGVIGEQDQLEVLLNIVNCIVHERNVTNVRFIIIGTGPNLKQVVAKSEEMKLDKYVLFTGFIPYDQVYEIFATADVCVNPEHRNDFTDKSTMIKIMEYMSFGKPIIQFDNAEGRVSAAEASLYIKDNSNQAFADALIELVQNTAKKQRMGEAGRKRVQTLLNWNIQKESLRRAYHALLSEQ